MTLPEHIEKYLGVIDGGWCLKNAGTPEIQVVKISDAPSAGVSTYSTLGLSAEVLSMPRNRTVQQELLFAAYERFDSNRIASFLLTFSEGLLRRGRALLRGEVIGPQDPIIPGVCLDSLYCTVPAMFNPGVASFQGEPPTVFVWLMPINRREADFIRATGWNAFEDALESATIDFWNLERASIPL